MNKTTMTILAASLLCGASVPAMSQQAQNESCTRLQQLAEQNRERFRPAWNEAARGVIKQGNAQNCQRYVTDAERAIRQLDAQAGQQGGAQKQNQQTQNQTEVQQQSQPATGSNIVVTQPQPEVTVQQSAPQVSVTQPQPEVTVNQQQPQIIVRQAQPTVRVQMPQPIITIDQPQPEIIVRMPPPEVAVNAAEPQVTVSQAQPQVQVRQPQPQVQVQMEKPKVNVEGSQQAEVNVQRQEPVVQLQQQGKPQVNVSQAQPQVSYEAAEPKVEVQQQGEPKVQFSQSGEPKIRMEQMGEENQQEASNTAEPGETTGSTTPPRLSDKDRQRIGMIDANEKPGKASAITVSELLNKQVINRQGEDLGSVKSVVSRENRQFVIISHGGLLGIGETNIAIPVERVSMAQDGRVMLRGLSEDELDNLTGFRMSNAQPLRANQTVNLTTFQQ